MRIALFFNHNLYHFLNMFNKIGQNRLFIHVSYVKYSTNLYRTLFLWFIIFLDKFNFCRFSRISTRTRSKNYFDIGHLFPFSKLLLCVVFDLFNKLGTLFEFIDPIERNYLIKAVKTQQSILTFQSV